MISEDYPKQQLLAGAKVLDAVLRPRGFRFALEQHAKGSGGWFASGSFIKAERRLELHFRQSLGLVTYHIKQDSLNHQAYMHLLGVYGRNEFPDFPDDHMQSFHHLAADIQHFCDDFTIGDGKQFALLADSFRADPRQFSGVP